MSEVQAHAEVDIDATPETVWELLVDFEDYPRWSKVHKEVRILTHNAEGWPERVWVRTSLAGIKDTQTVIYTWADDSVSWELEEPTKVQRIQRGVYTVTATEGGSHCTLDAAVDLAIPIPSLVIKQGQKIVLNIATRGVKSEAEKLQAVRDRA